MKLLILGAGHYGELVKDLASTKFEQIDFLDDKNDLAIGKLSDFSKYKYDYYFVAIGNNEVRKHWCNIIMKSGYKLATIISEKAYVSPSSRIGEGSIVENMAVVNSNSYIGVGTIISAGAIVNHNAVIGDYCHLDCDSIIGSDTEVPDLTKVMYGQVFKKPNTPPDGFNFDSGF